MIDQWIEQLKKGDCISEPDLKKLCIHVRLKDSFCSSVLLCLFMNFLGQKLINGRIECAVCAISSHGIKFRIFSRIVDVFTDATTVYIPHRDSL